MRTLAGTMQRIDSGRRASERTWMRSIATVCGARSRRVRSSSTRCRPPITPRTSAGRNQRPLKELNAGRLAGSTASSTATTTTN
jgi:hypothetical protein